MSWRNPHNQSAAYRRRAEEARENAGGATDEEARKRFLQEAETWLRMATYEDEHMPPQPAPDSNQDITGESPFRPNSEDVRSPETDREFRRSPGRA